MFTAYVNSLACENAHISAHIFTYVYTCYANKSIGNDILTHTYGKSTVCVTHWHALTPSTAMPLTPYLTLPATATTRTVNILTVPSIDLFVLPLQ